MNKLELSYCGKTDSMRRGGGKYCPCCSPHYYEKGGIKKINRMVRRCTRQAFREEIKYELAA